MTLLFLMVISGCDDKHKSNVKNITQQPTRSIQAEKLIGQIHMSIAALEVGLSDSAKAHIDKAITLTLSLKASAPELTNEQFVRLSKFSYTTELPNKDYFIPIAENIFLLDDYAQQQDNKNKQRIEADVEIVYSSFSLDLESTEKSLTKAILTLDNGDNELAQKILYGIFVNPIMDTLMMSNPLLEVLDNLEIARLLINDHQFYATSSSLTNIHTLLEDSDSIEHLPFTKSLLIRANTLRDNIEKKDITLLPAINREIAFLNRDIKEHLRIKKHSVSPKF